MSEFRPQTEGATEILEASMASSRDAVIPVAADGTVTDWHEAAGRLLGHRGEEVVGKEIHRVLLGDGGDLELGERLRSAIVDGREFQYETGLRAVDGRAVEVAVHSSPVSSPGGRRGGAIVFLHDLSERRRTERQLAYMTDHDPLTGLINRNRFTEEVDAALAEAEKGEIGGCLVLIDVDNFKLLNDRHGHAACDAVLCAMSRILTSHVGELDTVAHFGRDEFAVLLHGPNGRAAELRAAELLDGIPRAVLRSLEVSITVSAGLAEFRRGEARAAEELMVAADSALFEAKEKGRGHLVVHDPHTSRFAWAERIRMALATGGLELYAQPIMDVMSGDVVQQELLLRMRGPDGEVLEPAPFLSTAERLGMIGEVDRWVIHHGLQVAAEGQPVEINLSGQSLTDAGLIEMIGHELEVSGADPHDVIFEITETAAISNLGEATAFVRELSDLGCRFALDDFGTGFASFNYLKHLPISVLKIDGEFIRSVAENEIDQRIVQAIIYIAKGLGHKTVAEWVDDEKTLTLLRDWGVDYAQGYYVGRPAPLA